MKNLTLRYSLTHFVYWLAVAGASFFSTTIMLGFGLPSSLIGTLLAVEGLLACLTQPFLASLADRAKRFCLGKLLIVMSLICASCFAVCQLPNIPVSVLVICYLLGRLISDAMVSPLKALCISYEQAGYPINYGAARGIGSAATSFSALIFGYLLAWLGSAWMMALLSAFWIVFSLLLMRYPTIEKQTAQREQKRDESCSVPEFFSRYRWYCVSLLGVLFLGMFLAMTESYFILIFGQFGGDSSNVGTAHAIASIAAAPMIFSFRYVRKHLRDETILKIAACSFLLKAVLYCFARSITALYLLQLFHITSYALLEPVQVFFAQSRVRGSDMVKGQAFSTAAYSLGGAIGNFAGGILVEYSVATMLAAGIGMALLGTIILFAAVERKDSVLA